MSQKTVKLKDPIQFGSETISELVLQKPKAKHFRALPTQPDTGDILNLAGKLCGQPPSVIDELSIEDMAAVMEAVSDFLPSSLATGSKS